MGLFSVFIIFATLLIPIFAFHKPTRITRISRSSRWILRMSSTAMEELFENIVYSGDVSGFVKKSRDVLSAEFESYLIMKADNSDDDEEKQLIAEINELIFSKRNFLDAEKSAIDTFTGLDLSESNVEELVNRDEIEDISGTSMIDMLSYIKTVQSGKEVDMAQLGVVDKLGVLDRKKADSIKRNQQESGLEEKKVLVEGLDHGEKKAREVAAMIRRKEEAAIAAALELAELEAKSNREYKHF